MRMTKNPSSVVGLWSLVLAIRSEGMVAPNGRFVAPMTNDQWPTTNFHHRERWIPRQTSEARAVCYNHSFLQQVRGILVSPPGTPPGPAHERLRPPHLRAGPPQNRHRTAAQDRIWRIRDAPGFRTGQKAA